jgi:hypothetical protein
MTFAIRGVGIALPALRINQDEAVQVARAVCRPPPEQETLLPILYRMTGIETWHIAQPAEVLHDVLNGTNSSGSVFLPRA